MFRCCQYSLLLYPKSLVVRFALGNFLPTYLCFSQASRSTWRGGIAGTDGKAVLRRRVDSTALVPFRGTHLHIVLKREHQAWSKKKGKIRHVFGGEGWVSDQLFSPSTASQLASRRGRLVESRLESSDKERQNNHHLYPHYHDIEWQIFFIIPLNLLRWSTW